MMHSATGYDAGIGAPSGDQKIIKDLKVLDEQINLCREMLAAHPAGQSVAGSSDEALLGVIGFLEACAPRMVELIEAAAQGALQEATLIECLEVNDRLTKVLGDCENPTNMHQPAVAAAKASNPDDLDLDDLLLDDPKVPNLPYNSAKKPAAAVDPFTIDDFSTPTHQNNLQAKKDEVEDEFDAFFRERTA